MPKPYSSLTKFSGGAPVKSFTDIAFYLRCMQSSIVLLNPAQLLTRHSNREAVVWQENSVHAVDHLLYRL